MGILVLLVVVTVTILVVARLAVRDGGPHRPRAGRAEDHWSHDLPDHPYATNGLA